MGETRGREVVSAEVGCQTAGWRSAPSPAAPSLRRLLFCRGRSRAARP